MGKFKEKLKGRRQSTNVEDIRQDPISGIIAADKKKLEDKELQELKGNYSVHLRDKTPLAKQKSDAFTKFKNEKAKDPERMFAKAKKLMQLDDSIFPKEFSRLKK